jgi:hypothetical protein
MTGTTTVLGLTTIVGADTVDLPLHFSTGGTQRLEDVLTGNAAPGGNIALAFGTVTASRGLRLTETWNNAGVTFEALTVTATDGASAAGSTVLKAVVGATTVFSVRKDGLGTFDGGLAINGAITSATGLTVTTGGLTVSAGGATITGNSTITGTLGGLTGLTLASGQLLLPVGSAASPSLYFDSGNGLYSAGADRLNFATAGVVRAEFDAAGNLGLGVVPSAWNANRNAIQFGAAGALSGNVGGLGARLADNTYLNASVQNVAILIGGGSIIDQANGSITFYTAPSVAAGAVQTFTARLSITGTSDTALASAGNIFVSGAAPGNIFAPAADSGMNLGGGGNRWIQLYATTTTISTSLLAEKDLIEPLDIERAARVIRDTAFWRFTYKKDTEHIPRVGFVADWTDPLLTLDGKSVDPQATAAVVGAALQYEVARLDARLAALEAV